MKNKIIFCIITISVIVIIVILLNNNAKILDNVTKAYVLNANEMKERGHTTLINSKYNNVLQYNNLDGTRTIYVFSAPIEYINNEIVEINNDYMNTGTHTTKVFPKVINNVNGITVSSSSTKIVILPNDDIKSEAKIALRKNVFKQEINSINYHDFFQNNYNYYCYLTSFGINSEIIIPNNKGENTFKIKIQLFDNLIPDTKSPDYIIFRSPLDSDEVKAILYTPLIVDNNGKWCYENSVKLISKDNNTNIYTIEYMINEKFFNSPNTKYPITSNQSIHLYIPKQPDTSVYSQTEDEASHYLSPYLLLGDSTIKGEGWAYIRYETLKHLNINEEKIISAKYNFTNLFNLDSELKIGVHAATADWCSINTRWYNRPPFDENIIDEVIIKNAGDYYLDITPLLKEMIKNIKDKDAIYSIQNSFFIKSKTKKTNVILPSGDSGLFSPFLEIIIYP